MISVKWTSNTRSCIEFHGVCMTMLHWCTGRDHYNDVKLAPWCLLSPKTRLFIQQFSKLTSVHYWSFVSGFHWSSVDSPTKGQKCGNYSNGITLSSCGSFLYYGPLARYVKLRVAHAPGIPGTFPPPLRVIDHGTCVTHLPWCMPESPTSGFLWNRWREKLSWHSRRIRSFTYLVRGPLTWLYWTRAL